MENIDERVRRLVHPESCSLLLNTFQSAAAGTLKYRCVTNNQERRSVTPNEGGTISPGPNFFWKNSYFLRRALVRGLRNSWWN